MFNRDATVLFVLCFIVLGVSMIGIDAPYTYDSAELAVGAYTLGLVHAPGYPLYLVLAHPFAHLLLGSVMDGVSFFSVLCLALTTPLTYLTLINAGIRRMAAAAAILIVVWLYPLWSMAIIPEIYTPQILTLALVGYAWSRYHLQPNSQSLRAAAFLGVSCGLALGVHPGSILFFPGVLAVLSLKRTRYLHIGVFSLMLVLVLGGALLYFPIRYSDHPTINMLGMYDSRGTFNAVDLTHAEGIYWTISGQQFRNLFFAEGFVPTPTQLAQTLQMFGSHLHVIPGAVVLGGLAYMTVARRSILRMWLLFFVPFVLFYSAYGAVDRQTMFGPAYLLLTLPIAFGLQWVLEVLPAQVGQFAIASVPLMVLIATVGCLSSQSGVIRHTSELDCPLPPDAIVFANWQDITLLQYQQLIDGRYRNITSYNLFLFDDEALREFLRSSELYQSDRPVVMLSQTATRYLNDQFPSAMPILRSTYQGSLSADPSSLPCGFTLVRRKS